MKNKLSINGLFDLYKSERLPSEASIKNYKSLLRVYQGDTGIKTIEVSHNQIIDWRDQLLIRTSKITFNTYLRQMRAIYEVAVEYGYITENPFRKVKSLPVYHTQPKIIEKSVLKDVITICDNSEYYGWFWKIVIEFIYHTGIRRSQLTKITWEDIDFKKKILKIRASKNKTKRWNIIPINENNINNLILLNKKSSLVKIISINDQVFNLSLFNHKIKGDELTPEHISKFFQNISKQFPHKISAHRLRHTMATNIANHKYGKIRVLQQILGHKSILTTMIYVHPNITSMREAQELLHL